MDLPNLTPRQKKAVVAAISLGIALLGLQTYDTVNQPPSEGSSSQQYVSVVASDDHVVSMSYKLTNGTTVTSVEHSTTTTSTVSYPKE